MGSLGIILAAGGMGTRFGRNKLLEKLGEFSVLSHSLNAFYNLVSKTESVVMIVGAASCLDAYRSCVEKELPNMMRHCKFVEGGKSRQESVLNGLKALDDEVKHVIVHDAARPFVSEKIIEECLQMALEKGNAVAAHYMTDTVKRFAADGTIIETIPRDELCGVETPQIFDQSLLRAALEWNGERGFCVTDESMAVQMAFPDIKIHLYLHQEDNSKITFYSDLKKKD